MFLLYKLIHCIGSISIIHGVEGYCRHAHISYVLQCNLKEVCVLIVEGLFIHLVETLSRNTASGRGLLKLYALQLATSEIRIAVDNACILVSCHCNIIVTTSQTVMELIKPADDS